MNEDEGREYVLPSAIGESFRLNFSLLKGTFFRFSYRGRMAPAVIAITGWRCFIDREGGRLNGLF